MIFIDVYPFQTTDLFLYPLIISDNNRFSVVHRGYREKTSSMKWIKKHRLTTMKLVRKYFTSEVSRKSL